MHREHGTEIARLWKLCAENAENANILHRLDEALRLGWRIFDRQGHRSIVQVAMNMLRGKTLSDFTQEQIAAIDQLLSLLAADDVDADDFKAAICLCSKVELYPLHGQT